MNARSRALRLLSNRLSVDGQAKHTDLPPIRRDDWPGILALANEHLITAKLRGSLAPHRHGVPPEVWRYLDYLYTMNCRRNRAVRRQALTLVGAFNDIGVEPLLLKGILMTLFERRVDIGSRMMADIDIAVPAPARGDALRVMDRLGYRPRCSFPEGHHAIGEFVRPGDPAAVDLHVELIDQNRVLASGEVWTEAQRVAHVAGATYRVPDATHRILHNILHAQVHFRGGFYMGELDLRQLVELAELVRLHGAAIDWDRIQRCLEAHRLGIALESYLENAQLLLGLRWPLRKSCRRRARLHAWRCRMQAKAPVLNKAAAPWGNLRAAFAWHRMSVMYGGQGGDSLDWRRRHVRHLFDRHPATFMLQRLFRT
jgi:hypothetical protein